MRAVVDDGPKDVSVNEVPDAAIEAPADAVVTTSATNICGSDLHIYQAGAADWRLARSSGTTPALGKMWAKCGHGVGTGQSADQPIGS